MLSCVKPAALCSSLSLRQPRNGSSSCSARLKRLQLRCMLSDASLQAASGCQHLLNGIVPAHDSGVSIGFSSAVFLMDIGLDDWFSNLLYNAGQSANESVEVQLTTLSPAGQGGCNFWSRPSYKSIPLHAQCLAIDSWVHRSYWSWEESYAGAGGFAVVFFRTCVNISSLGCCSLLGWQGLWPDWAGATYRGFCFGNGDEIIELQLPSFFGDFDPRTAAASLPTSIQAYLAGLTFALAASPCSSPVLATILGYVAASQDVVIGGGLLLAYTTGYVAPLLLAASFTGALQGLLSFRQYSAWINPTSGALLVGGGLYTFLDRVFPASSMAMNM